MKPIYVYLRTSDKGNLKNKLPFATREYCITKTIEQFGREHFCIITDNCEEATIQWVKDLGVRCVQTNLGNSGSFQYLIDLIIKERNPDDIVYLLEDDYIHRPGSALAIAEGVELAEYVTLYDHPDYYEESFWHKSGGNNPLMWKYQMKSKLYVSEHFHWRTTYSTTMTFASKVKYLIEDQAVLKRYTKYRIPLDFSMWLELTNDAWKNLFINVLFQRSNGVDRRHEMYAAFKGLFRGKKRRKLISCIPGLSTHTETAFLSPCIEWKEER